jgi:acetoacetyl-CoA synthetase
MRDDKPLWIPSRTSVEASPIFALMQKCNHDFGLSMSDYGELHAWSVADREKFWTAVWEFCEVKGDRGARVLVDGDVMLDARFFPMPR